MSPLSCLETQESGWTLFSHVLTYYPIDQNDLSLEALRRRKRKSDSNLISSSSSTRLNGTMALLNYWKFLEGKRWRDEAERGQHDPFL